MIARNRGMATGLLALALGVGFAVAATATSEPASEATSRPTSGPATSRPAASQKARVVGARIDVDNLALAMRMFEVEAGRYPTTEEGIGALIKQPGGLKGWNGPYLEKKSVPKDPWGNPYQYRCPGLQNPNGFDLWSYGPDGQDGGGDDIDNWSDK